MRVLSDLGQQQLPTAAALILQSLESLLQLIGSVQLNKEAGAACARINRVIMMAIKSLRNRWKGISIDWFAVLSVSLLSGIDLSEFGRVRH